MDSNSDEDISNEFSYNFKNVSVSVKGPNLSTIRNNNMVRKMTRDFVQPEDTRSVYDHRSIYSGRGTSPRSVRSVCDFQPRNFKFSHYPSDMSSQSVYSHQTRNPMGLSSYVSATDIVLSLKYHQFNKLDVAIIKKAYKVFINRFKDSDSGEQGSDSSLSNDDDDNRSTRNSIFKDNISSYKSSKPYLTNSRISKQQSMYNGSSANYRQNPFRNTYALNMEKQNNTLLQKDRFKNRYLLPSQRFNRSIAASAITENTSKIQHTANGDVNIGQRNNDNNTVPGVISESNHEEIVLEGTVRKNNNRVEPCKRKLEEDQSTVIANKKRVKRPDVNQTENQNTKIIDKDGETQSFSFVKPSLPITKLSKAKIKETLVSNSAQPLVDITPIPQLNTSLDVDESVEKSLSDPNENSTSNVSTRPSFIKRKLFTQKLDVIDNKNTSYESVNSPINVSSQIQREKNKTRKLVSNQSCLNRDVTQETNFIDLIHKIVPLSQNNSTIQNNKVVDNNKEDVRNRWDVTSIISECHNSDGSDTYTDEDIFEQNTTDCIKDNKLITNDKNRRVIKNCQVVIEKNNLSINNFSKTACITNNEHEKLTSDKHKQLEAKDNKMKSKIFTIKSVWDTDLESDLECQNLQKKCPESLNKDKVTDDKSKTKAPTNTVPESLNKDKISENNNTKIRVNNFWDTDLESDFECQNVQKKFPGSMNKDKVSENLQNNKGESCLALLAKSLDDNNHSSNKQTIDNKSNDSSTLNISNINFKIKSHRAPKKKTSCTETEVTINKVPSTNVKCDAKHNDNCVAKIANNNKQLEDIENSTKKGVIINKNYRTLKDSQVCKPKQIYDKADKGTKKAPVAKRKLKDTKTNKSDTSVQRNDNTKTVRGQTKQKKLANMHTNLPESELDISFSLLNSTVITRSKRRAIIKLTSNSTSIVNNGQGGTKKF